LIKCEKKIVLPDKIASLLGNPTFCESISLGRLREAGPAPDEQGFGLRARGQAWPSPPLLPGRALCQQSPLAVVRALKGIELRQSFDDLDTADRKRHGKKPATWPNAFFSERRKTTSSRRRSLPRDPTPSFMGYSVGRWEEDTLVVESIGLNDRTLLDTGGHPHTEDLHITERFRRRDFGHIDLVVTFSDPALYRKPITVSSPMQYVADDELIEYVCRENEQDYQHIGNVPVEQYRTTPAISRKICRSVYDRIARRPELPPTARHVIER
jgi:hypothetical protein